MPAGDRTGPQGFGPLTGRGFGLCGRGVGIGLGMGRGMKCRRGLGRYFGWTTYENKEAQIKDYEDFRQALKEELEDIDKAIASLQKTE